ncbi:MAG: DUF433 domain-containing protein [Actinophytocola sp.]|nr:DUF433 domain-containing protein [Actinophytocola sp.]
MTYAPHMAAALSGATVRQLAHWRKSAEKHAVLVPEVSATRPILYSFRDVVALRTCVYLRKDSPLQRIRRALGNLRDLGEVEHLSRYKLVSVDGSIALMTPEAAVDLVKQPGQFYMAAMSDVLASFTNKSDVKIPDLLHPRAHIEVDPEIRLGHPVIAGTRVPYEQVASLVADGVPANEIELYYPSVDAAAARDAAAFATYVDSWRPKERQNTAA